MVHVSVEMRTVPSPDEGIPPQLVTFATWADLIVFVAITISVGIVASSVGPAVFEVAKVFHFAFAGDVFRPARLAFAGTFFAVTMFAAF